MYLRREAMAESLKNDLITAKVVSVSVVNTPG